MTLLLSSFKYKNLASELTDDEFDQFFISLRRTKGREFLLDLLCQQQDITLNTEMIQIASSIIQKRETQQQETVHWSLDTLPNAFIGEIASNLYQRDYASLSRVNRTIYIGCNDPNRLLSIAWNGGAIKFNKYPKIQKLSIDMAYEDLRFPDSDRPICSHLTRLHLSQFCNQQEWDSILHSSVQPARLQHLLLSDASIPSMDILHRLLSKFNTVQHLDLEYISIARAVTLFPILFTESLPNLNSLTVLRSGSLALQFLQLRGANLLQLDLIDTPSFRVLMKVKFTKLQRLRITEQMPPEFAKHIVATASNLNSVCFRIVRQSEPINKEAISRFISGLFTEKKTLTHFHVQVSDSICLEAACQAIGYGLESTKKWNRKLMSVGLEISDKLERSVMMVHISSILGRLRLCQIGEWSLFVRIEGSLPPKLNKTSLVAEVKELVRDLGDVELVRSEGCVFIIRSKGSKINSYRMWWKEGYLGEDDRVIY